MSRRTVAIDGRELVVSNLDKVLYPATGFTKAHVLFQKEDRNTYIKRLLTTAASDQQVTVEA